MLAGSGTSHSSSGGLAKKHRRRATSIARSDSPNSGRRVSLQSAERRCSQAASVDLTPTTATPPRNCVRRILDRAWQRVCGVPEKKKRHVWEEVSSDSELEEEEPRYRPDSLRSLTRLTRFSESELKRIYRSFKAECPTGVVREDAFRDIYGRFFPSGASASPYARYVFNTFSQAQTGLLSFEEFVLGLSVLARGSPEERMRWVFTLYDLDGDGKVTRDELALVVAAVHALLGRCAPPLQDSDLRERVEVLFQKLDLNQDGVVTLDEFLTGCRLDAGICRSLTAFDPLL